MASSVRSLLRGVTAVVASAVTMACSLTTDFDSLAGGGATRGAGASSKDELAGSGADGTPPTATNGAPSADGTPALDTNARGTTFRERVVEDAPALYLRFGSATDELGRMTGKLLARSSVGTPGLLGSALTVNDGGLEFGRVFDFANVTPFSLEAIFRFDSSSNGSFQRLFNKDDKTGQGGRQNYVLAIEGSSPVLLFERVIDGAQRQVQVPVSKGEWHHVVATYDGATLRLFVDGSLGGSVGDARPARVKNSNFLVGTNNDLDAPLRGAIDEAVVYHKALGAAQVRAHFAATGL